MDDIASIPALRARLAAERSAGRRIGLVATMGALHKGHLKLVDAAREHCDFVVMSVFVNPLQFAPGEDFTRYPRDLARDRALATDRGVDVLFAPSSDEMYGSGADIRVSAGELGTRLEGAIRPGHFDGVLTVVAKLFNVVGSQVACFGQKDIQQLALIRRMVRELDFPIQLVMVPIERESDGLAMSSRNAYLSPADRESARALSQALGAARDAWRAGETDAQQLQQAAAAVLRAAPGVVPDYIVAVDPDDLAPVTRAAPGVVIALAARVGGTRLIDNLILGE